MNLSVLKLVLLLGAVQGLVLGAMLLSRQANRAANRVFAFLLLLLSIHLTLVAFDERAFFMQFPHLSHITWLIPVLYGPLILLFLRRMTGIAPAFQRQELLYFLPFLIWLTVLLPYYWQPASTKLAYLSDYEAAVQDDFGLLNQLTNLLHLVFFGICIASYRRFERQLPNFYSDLTRVRMHWLRNFLYLTFAILAFGIPVFYAAKFNWPVLSAFYPYHFLGVVVLIYWTAYKAMAQPALFGHPEQTGHEKTRAALPANEPARPEGAGSFRLDPEAREKLARQLSDLMDRQQLYLQPELTLQDLCDSLQSNKQYVSETLNGYFGKNFYDFVNDYRIEAFKRKAADPSHQHLSILGMALESGFNSKATFNAVFKKKTSMTPSAFYQALRSGTANPS